MVPPVERVSGESHGHRKEQGEGYQYTPGDHPPITAGYKNKQNKKYYELTADYVTGLCVWAYLNNYYDI